jgi:Zn-dependent protease
MSEGLTNVLLLVPVFLFSLSFHEYAHGWMALQRGDATAQMAGRLSLHPLAHADLLGTLILPIVCIYNGWPFIGWANPVPVDTRNLRHPRRDMALVAVAGPASNLILALLAAVFLGAIARAGIQTRWMETVELMTLISIQVNLMLAAFNLIPVPPLDGFNILQAALPRRAAAKVASYSRAANLILILLLFTGGFRVLLYPVNVCYHFLLHAAGV